MVRNFLLSLSTSFRRRPLQTPYALHELPKIVNHDDCFFLDLSSSDRGFKVNRLEVWRLKPEIIKLDELIKIFIKNHAFRILQILKHSDSQS